jgi:hypothetical protein
VDLKKEESKAYYFMYLVRLLFLLLIFFDNKTYVTRYKISSYFVSKYAEIDIADKLEVYSDIIKHKLFTKARLEKIKEAKKENAVYCLEIVKYSKSIFTESIAKYNISTLFFKSYLFVLYCTNPFTKISSRVLSEKTAEVSTSKSVINLINVVNVKKNIWFFLDNASKIIQNINIKGGYFKNNIYIQEKKLQESWLKSFYTKAIYNTNNFKSSYVKLNNLAYYTFSGF